MTKQIKVAIDCGEDYCGGCDFVMPFAYGEDGNCLAFKKRIVIHSDDTGAHYVRCSECKEAEVK